MKSLHTQSKFSLVSKSYLHQTTLKFLVVLICLFAWSMPGIVSAQQPNWIWSPKKDIVAPGESQGECYYRKQFTLVKPEQAELEMAAGDEFEFHINGQLVSRGQSYGSPTKIDVGPMLQPGVNLIAAKVRHNSSNQPGLNAKLRIREKGETRWRSLITDDSWKTRIDFADGWQKTSYNDMGWLSSINVGPANNAAAQTANATVQPPTSSIPGTTEPIHQRKKETAAQQVSSPSKKPKLTADGRFEIDPEFVVQEVLTPAETGSLIAMEFNEFGQMLLSREGGPLLIADPTQPAGSPTRVRVYCKEVNSCQGILPLNGNVYVTAQGPEGLGLYLLSDTDRNGSIDSTKKMLSFSGELGEHGPHGIQLGPDGMIYVIVGNGSQLTSKVAKTSPYKNFYEGDLVPRYEDPGGHAVGMKAPGGTIIRMSVDGKKVERVAGGIRNAYDLVFDDRGDLFIHDSDMESDEGMTWYRPTNVYHVTAGAEMGWRSGWAKFPMHFVDQTPAVCDTGRGSPTGAVLYQHLQFPVRYQNTVFLADWSEGRIIALHKSPVGASVAAKPETFLSGTPLNVCDLAIAEDGAMYFCTGGRGTSGGVFRVVWNGQVPDKMMDFESDLAKVIRHPQPNSAWARQSIAELKKMLGKDWGTSLEGVATEARNPSKFRIRAMQLMVLYGPAPSADFLKKIATDKEVDVRAEVARICGLKGDTQCQTLLNQLLADDSGLVRRVTCESFLRLGVQPEPKLLLPVLTSLDRVESGVARKLLEQIPVEKWESLVLNSTDKRVFIQGSIAMMAAAPSLERSYQVLASASTLMDGFVNDLDFVDLLRVMELALVQGQVDPQRVPGLSARIANEFPSGNTIINQELARLMAYLKVGDVNGRIESHLQSNDVPLMERVHIAMYLQTIGDGLSDEARLAIIDCLESAREAENTGGSYALYLQRAVEDVSATMSSFQVNTVLRNGSKWPNAVLAAFYKMPEQLDSATVEQVIELDQAIQNNSDSASQQLRLGVIAILARSSGGASMEYLRQLWQSEENRRNDIVIGLAQSPAGENWPYLVSSLPILDDLTGREVVQKLATIPRRPKEAQHFRDVIELGYRLRNEGATDAVNLLEYWSGETPEYTAQDWRSRLQAWNGWFNQKWPDQPALADQAAVKSGRYSVNDVLVHLEQNGLGDYHRGQQLFTTAKCAMCHRLGAIGQNVGPDLSSLPNRFSVREVVEATLEPSKIIPDRYHSKLIVTKDGDQFSGMTVKQNDGAFVVLRDDGKRIRIPADDVETVKDSTISGMPTGLIDGLTPAQIADLMAFVMQQKTEVAELK